RATGVDQKSHLQPDRLASARAAEFHHVPYELRAIQLNPVEIFCSLADRLVDKELVYVSTEPMGIGDFVTRAGSHEQFIPVVRLIFPGLVQLMIKEGEAALETAGDIRIGLLPTAPFCEWSNPRQVPAAGELFEDQIG